MASMASMRVPERDRTEEFNKLLEEARRKLVCSFRSLSSASNFLKLRGQSADSSVGACDAQDLQQSSTQQSKRSGGSSSSEFAQRAAQIGRDIHTTAQRVQELANLAKQTSTFDDHSSQINALASDVKEDIQHLHSSIAQLQNMLTGGPSRQFDSHSSTVVQALKSRLAGTTQEFKDALDRRQATIKESSQRRQLYSSMPSSPPLAPTQPSSQQQQPPPHVAPTHLSGNQPQGGMSHAQSLRNGVVNPQAGPPFAMQQELAQDTRSAQQHFATQKQQQQVQKEQSQQGFDLESQSYGDDLFLQSRASALEGIERTIGELQGIFQQLASMVEEQGEKAARVDENIEESISNVDSAKAQLDKYLASIKSNWKLMAKVVAVIIVFMVFFAFIA